MEYWEKYKDPRWQMMRLEVMKRESFVCEHCGSRDATLNVHHSFYDRGKEPWEYSSFSLRCLCSKCHEKHHAYMRSIRWVLSHLNEKRLARVSGYAKGRVVADVGQPVEITSYEEFVGFCDATCLPEEELYFPQEEFETDEELERYLETHECIVIGQLGDGTMFVRQEDLWRAQDEIGSRWEKERNTHRPTEESWICAATG